MNHMLFRFKRKYLKLVGVEVDGIDTRDYPDFCDAFICDASWKVPFFDIFIQLSERDLEYLNEDTNLVYGYVIDHLY